MAQVIYSPDAEADLLSIATWIAHERPDAALRWVARIRETCEVLATHADMGEDRRSYGVPGCRSFSVGNHVIFFRAIQSGIAVARIMDGRRDL